jgi:hypothetical protein
MGQGPRRGVQDRIPEWWERKYIPPDPKPLPSVPVEDVAVKAVTPSVKLDDRLYGQLYDQLYGHPLYGEPGIQTKLYVDV